MSIIGQYIAAFNTAYPQKQVEVKFASKRSGEAQFHVIVDSERGGDPLTEADMAMAIRGFLAGR
jgi:hypothetical protein